MGHVRRAAQLVLAAAAMTVLVAPVPSRAEFEIQESTIDEGEIQLQYRGAWHSGLPAGDADLFVIPDDEEAPVLQSHEFELQMSVTSHWLLAFSYGVLEQEDDTLQLTTIEFESQVELITREGDGLGFAVQGGTEQPVFKYRRRDPYDVHFGPIVELAKDKFVLTLNPMFFKLRGQYADQEGLGFEYGWQARYEKSERLFFALEMFGEVEDFAAAGGFSEQPHSIGPAFYYTLGTLDDEVEEGEKYDELTLSLGAQFGLTPQASDFALKVFIGYEFN